jgi:hypothetical protein
VIEHKLEGEYLSCFVATLSFNLQLPVCEGSLPWPGLVWSGLDDIGLIPRCMGSLSRIFT